MHDVHGVQNQRGVALVVTLLVLLFLSLLVSALMVSINVETQMSGRNQRSSRALNNAEAGIAEAMERIRNDDIDDTGDPESVWQIFLASPGSVPSVGADTIALGTGQDPANWLKYSSPTKGPGVLTVTYKTDANRKVIYRYDETKVPPVQTLSGKPIYQVTVTGQSGDAERTIVTEVFERDVPTFVKGAAGGGKAVKIVKDTWICGYNHRADTPPWTAIPKGRSGAKGTCNEDLSKQLWETGSGDIVGAWSTGTINKVTNGKQYGSPAAYLENQVGAPTGPWDVFGMTQAEFFAMTGPPVVNPFPLNGNLDGIRYYKGAVQIKAGTGEGLLFVDGNLDIKGDLVYKGLIYATGFVKFMGRDWVLGAVMAGTDIHFNGTTKEMAILYSHDAIVEGISRQAGPFVTLSWREKP